MIAFVILLIAAMSTMCRASRMRLSERPRRPHEAHGLNFVPAFGVGRRTMTGPMIRKGPKILIGPTIDRARNLAILRMQGAPSDEDKPKSRSNEKAHTSHQSFPPTKLLKVDTRQLLYNWQSADAVTDPSEESIGTGDLLAEQLRLQVIKAAALESLLKNDSFPLLPNKRAKHRQRDRTTVLQDMLDVIETSDFFLESGPRSVELSNPYMPEAVGLVPKGLEPLLLESSAVGASVLALGVFSREKLKDDTKGSLRQKVEERFGEQILRRLERWDRGKNRIDVFAIEGLVQGPGLPELSSRVLLAKIAKYAEKEQKLVVVPRRAYFSVDGKDLTEYYLRLGFEKVKMMSGYTLVYTGSSSSSTDTWVEDQQVMVGMNLWTPV